MKILRWCENSKEKHTFKFGNIAKIRKIDWSSTIFSQHFLGFVPVCLFRMLKKRGNRTILPTQYHLIHSVTYPCKYILWILRDICRQSKHNTPISTSITLVYRFRDVRDFMPVPCYTMCVLELYGWNFGFIIFFYFFGRSTTIV